MKTDYSTRRVWTTGPCIILIGMAWLGEELPQSSKSAPRHCPVHRRAPHRKVLVRDPAGVAELFVVFMENTLNFVGAEGQTLAAWLLEGSPTRPDADIVGVVIDAYSTTSPNTRRCGPATPLTSAFWCQSSTAVDRSLPTDQDALRSHFAVGNRAEAARTPTAQTSVTALD